LLLLALPLLGFRNQFVCIGILRGFWRLVYFNPVIDYFSSISGVTSLYWCAVWPVSIFLGFRKKDVKNMGLGFLFKQ
jgi:hypothetical protein